MSLAPTYTGYIGSTKDAVLVIQGVLSNQFQVVQRRPHDRERPDLIKSGSVFIFIEEQSGIRRWTDGISWSPSRILGRFLVYKELNKSAHQDREEKKKRKRSSDSQSLSRRSSFHHSDQSRFSSLSSESSDINHRQKSDETYHFNPNLPMVKKNPYIPLSTDSAKDPHEDHGLIKKTLSVTTSTSSNSSTDKSSQNESDSKQTIHLISYYTAYDVLSGRLLRPTQTNLRYLPVASNLWESVQKSTLGGKIPIEDEAYYFLDSNYQLQNMSVLMTPGAGPGTGPGQLPSGQFAPGQLPSRQIAPGQLPSGHIQSAGKSGPFGPKGPNGPNGPSGGPDSLNAGNASMKANATLGEHTCPDTGSADHAGSVPPLATGQSSLMHNASAPNQNPALSKSPYASTDLHSSFLQQDPALTILSSTYPHALPYHTYNANAALLNPAATSPESSIYLSPHLLIPAYSNFHQPHHHHLSHQIPQILSQAPSQIPSQMLSQHQDSFSNYAYSTHHPIPAHFQSQMHYQPHFHHPFSHGNPSYSIAPHQNPPSLNENLSPKQSLSKDDRYYPLTLNENA